jgi:(2R)-ethylmalonyl-CoA mutase
MGATQDIRLMVAELGEKLGETPRLVVGKPGLDGHSNGAEQIALRARDVGLEVSYDGIRQTPAEIVARARETKAHVIGLSILSGSHVPLVREVKARLRLEGLDHVPVVVGGIISAEDDNVLRNMGVAAVYTPKDYALDAIMADMVRVVERAAERRGETEKEQARPTSPGGRGRDGVSRPGEGLRSHRIERSPHPVRFADSTSPSGRGGAARRSASSSGASSRWP